MAPSGGIRRAPDRGLVMKQKARLAIFYYILIGRFLQS